MIAVRSDDDSDEAQRVHPDEMARRCFWAPSPRVAPSTRTSGTITRYAPQCLRCPSTTWCPKSTTGHGRSKQKLAEPIPVCVRCGSDWETWPEDDHMQTGAPGSGITKRGRWTRYLHVRASSPPRTSTEDRIYGNVNLGELLRMQRIAQQMYRSPVCCWQARTYFAYVLGFARVRGRGGCQALAVDARTSWPRAPFQWHRNRVQDFVAEGRAEWAKRLARAGLIAEGDWWQDDARDRER